MMENADEWLERPFSPLAMSLSLRPTAMLGEGDTFQPTLLGEACL